MSWKVVSAIAVIALWLAAGSTNGQERLYVAEVRNRSVISLVPSKLSPALVAVKDSDGVLKGSDEFGRPIIALLPANAENLRASRAVISIADPPKGWEPETPALRLKLSYMSNRKPSDGYLKSLGLKLVEDYQKGSFLIVEPRRIDAGLAGRLEETGSGIAYVTPTFRVKALPPLPQGLAKKTETLPTNDPVWNDLWGMRSIRAPKAWKKVTSSPAIVAVLDTGVDYKHEDLAKNMWIDSNKKYTKHGYNFVDRNDDPMDKNGHGTHCAGTIGAVGNNGIGVVGVNWDVKIMALRWLDAKGSGKVEDAIKAIDFAVEHKANVLSNSWFWHEDDPDLEAAIKRADERNVLFVAAASNFALRPKNNDGDNDKPDTHGRYPSCYAVKNIVAVAAIDEEEKKADFSNFGKKTVYLGAPGVLIRSTVPRGNYDGTFSGTSMAAPHVAGAAALILGHPEYKGITTAKLKKLLGDNARQLPDMKDRCVSGGTLDISFLGK